jgi:hypothetical protein
MACEAFELVLASRRERNEPIRKSIPSDPTPRARPGADPDRVLPNVGGRSNCRLGAR